MIIYTGDEMTNELREEMLDILNTKMGMSLSEVQSHLCAKRGRAFIPADKLEAMLKQLRQEAEVFKIDGYYHRAALQAV